MTDDTVNIIVIGYTINEEMAQIESDCLESILDNTTDCEYVLTFFNNYKSGSSLTHTWNRLIKESKCKYICLLNSDTIVYPGWLSKQLETLKSSRAYGFVGPSTNSCHSSQNKIPTFEASQKLPPNSVKILSRPICGFCLVFRKAVFLELGCFDERFTLYGQESDLLKRAAKRGYKFVWRQDAFVYHMGGATMKMAKVNIPAERNKARTIYNGKHGIKILQRPVQNKFINNKPGRRKNKSQVMQPATIINPKTVYRKYK
jgi:GT2 family glycosyltransferase